MFLRRHKKQRHRKEQRAERWVARIVPAASDKREHKITARDIYRMMKRKSKCEPYKPKFIAIMRRQRDRNKLARAAYRCFTSRAR